jgi:glyoxylase-like metal-dependent hydrolase (beta-lactamase superfamily II)
LPEHGVLFTGDTVAETQGTVMLGVFNLDRERAAESFCRLAGLDTDVACFGHGDPVVGSAGTKLRAVASTLGG